ncbi:O-antigen ligase family protein [Planctopirus hydrillae]|uniref:O-antigen ligase-related domain-containing protein n=1 Tax=Planctopirus hydrillae TaxID=1841610 RepID=A0A1C3EQC9_9PLAN|nr:O-antigen ligase family protein [Planctopirus hydrillae]ODA35444.1 hypothetical protein A6X21_16640 [Planctopirus hydrillae]
MPSLRTMALSIQSLLFGEQAIPVRADLEARQSAGWLWMSARGKKPVVETQRAGTSTGQRMVQEAGGRVEPSRWQESVAGWLVVLLASLFFARFWTPPEAAVMGESLWLAILSMATAAMLLIFLPKTAPVSSAWRSGFVWGWLLLTAGQVAGTIHVWLAQGDRRAAANLLIEFFSLAMGACVLWRLAPRLAERPGHVIHLNAIWPFVITTLLSMSVLGLYQHEIGLPAISGRYIKAIQELDRLEGLQERSAEEESKISQLRQKLESDGIPTELHARRAFFQRLTSSEPYGFCALANTFAAVLLVLLILSLFAWPEVTKQRTMWSWPDLSRPFTWMLLAAWLLGGWTLLLTKSRTAVLALAVTMLLLAVRPLVGQWKAVGNPRVSSRSWLWIFGAGSGAMLLLVGLVAWRGGLDLEVITEAPKSLRYRLEYWVATLQMLADHPWLGVGPGNFRSVYLSYKLPSSSEEIADPHNMVLEAWSSGGILSLAGLLVLAGTGLFALGRGLWNSSSGVNEQASAEVFFTQNSRAVHLPAHWPMWAGAGSLAIAWWGRFLLDGVFDDALIVFGIFWTGLYLIIDRWGCNASKKAEAAGESLAAPQELQADRNTTRGFANSWGDLAFPAAAFALGVNLLAAGGFGMAAILGLWLLLITLSTWPVGAAVPQMREPGEILAVKPGSGEGFISSIFSWGSRLLPGAMVLVMVLSIWGAWPVWMVSQGRIQMSARPATTRSAAIREMVKLAEWDEWSPSLAETAGMAWFSNAESSTEWADGEKWMKSASQRDFHSYRPHEQLARAYFERAVSSPAERQIFAEKAVESFEEANRRYRSSSRLLAGAAEALALAGQRKEASIQANLALEQDELNRQLGHSDRVLPEEVVERLKRLQSEKLDEDPLNKVRVQ